MHILFRSQSIYLAQA